MLIFYSTYKHTPTQTHILLISLASVLFVQPISSFDSHLLASLPQSSVAQQTEHDLLKLRRHKPLSLETSAVM